MARWQPPHPARWIGRDPTRICPVAGEQPYRSMAAAGRALVRLGIVGIGGWTVVVCAVCGGWHLASTREAA